MNQGDIPVITVESLSPSRKPTNLRFVGIGESTGHRHEIVGECELYEVERDFYGQLFRGLEVIVATDSPVCLRHNSGGEHGDLELAPGIYFIPLDIQQVEYDGEKERRALD